MAIESNRCDLQRMQYAPPPDLLAGLIEDQIVVAEGEKKSRIYKLKEKASM